MLTASGSGPKDDPDEKGIVTLALLLPLKRLALSPKDDPDEKGIVTKPYKLQPMFKQSPKDDPDEKGIVT